MEGLDYAFIRDGIAQFIIIVCCFGIHEWAHARTALYFGDDTAEREGRVTLNPLAHIDLLGTIIFPLFCIFFLRGSFFLGWAKPTPVNPSLMRGGARSDAIVTAAGPFSHFVIMMLAGVIGGFVCRFAHNLQPLFEMIIGINAWLLVFNLLPLPPLDGGRLLRYFTGMSWETFTAISRFSMFGLLIAFRFVPFLPKFFGMLIGLAEVPALLPLYVIGGR